MSSLTSPSPPLHSAESVFAEFLYHTHLLAKTVAPYYTEQIISRDPWQIALQNFCKEIMQLVETLDYFQKANFNPNQPRTPRGQTGGGQWSNHANDHNAIARWHNWAQPETLERHAIDHQSDFNKSSVNDYAKQARKFYNEGMQRKLPTLEYPKGRKIAIYDPKTNTFGAYSADGRTYTFFKPKEGEKYFQKLIEKQISRGGRIINSLSSSSSRGGGGHTGGGDSTDGLKPWKIPIVY